MRATPEAKGTLTRGPNDIEDQVKALVRPPFTEEEAPKRQHI